MHRMTGLSGLILPTNAAVAKPGPSSWGLLGAKVGDGNAFCLWYYLERQLGLDLDPNTIEPERQQVVLLNRSELTAVNAAYPNGTARVA